MPCILPFENIQSRDFPGGPEVKTLCFQSRGHGFDFWLGEQDHTCLGSVARKGGKCTVQCASPTPPCMFRDCHSQV